MNYWEPYGNIPKKFEKECEEGQISIWNLALWVRTLYLSYQIT